MGKTSPSSLPLWRQAQQWLEPALCANAVAVDATCGNGGDTVFLASKIGPAGMVLGIDIQEEAINRTAEALGKNGLRARLIRGDHAHLEEILKEEGASSVDAAILNLGFLPRGDHRITTKPESTCEAISALIRRASECFRLAVVAYRGHPGGSKETEMVLNHLSSHRSSGFLIQTFESRNLSAGPVLFTFTRDYSTIRAEP